MVGRAPEEVADALASIFAGVAETVAAATAMVPATKEAFIMCLLKKRSKNARRICGGGGGGRRRLDLV